MKFLMSITFAFLFSFNLAAQSVKIKGEKVLVDKELYCYLETGGSAMSVWTYSIKNLNQAELLFLKSNTVQVGESIKVYLTVTVAETEETFEIEYFLGFKKDFIRKLYKYEVIKNNEINEAGLEKYKRTYAGDFSEQYEKEADRAAGSTTIINNSNGNNNSEDYIIVKRNTKANIFVINGTVKQQGTEIATYETDSEATGGKIIKTVKIYNVNSQLVAQLQYESFEKAVTIITLKDNKKHQVSSDTNLDKDKIKASMKLLIEYLYI